MSNEKSGKSRRGFASMDPARQREIASLGGRTAQERGTGRQWTAEQAREAGLKGGRSLVQTRGSAHMAEIGRKGGKSRWAKVAR